MPELGDGSWSKLSKKEKVKLFLFFLFILLVYILVGVLIYLIAQLIRNRTDELKIISQKCEATARPPSATSTPSDEVNVTKDNPLATDKDMEHAAHPNQSISTTKNPFGTDDEMEKEIPKFSTKSPLPTLDPDYVAPGETYFSSTTNSPLATDEEMANAAHPNSIPKKIIPPPFLPEPFDPVFTTSPSTDASDYTEFYDYEFPLSTKSPLPTLDPDYAAPGETYFSSTTNNPLATDEEMANAAHPNNIPKKIIPPPFLPEPFDPVVTTSPSTDASDYELYEYDFPLSSKSPLPTLDPDYAAPGVTCFSSTTNNPLATDEEMANGAHPNKLPKKIIPPRFLPEPFNPVVTTSPSTDASDYIELYKYDFPLSTKSPLPTLDPDYAAPGETYFSSTKPPSAYTTSRLAAVKPELQPKPNVFSTKPPSMDTKPISASDQEMIYAILNEKPTPDKYKSNFPYSSTSLSADTILIFTSDKPELEPEPYVADINPTLAFDQEMIDAILNTKPTINSTKPSNDTTAIILIHEEMPREVLPTIITESPLTKSPSMNNDYENQFSVKTLKIDSTETLSDNILSPKNASLPDNASQPDNASPPDNASQPDNTSPLDTKSPKSTDEDFLRAILYTKTSEQRPPPVLQASLSTGSPNALSSPLGYNDLALHSINKGFDQTGSEPETEKQNAGGIIEL